MQNFSLNNMAAPKLSKEEIRMYLRKLWLDHVYLTRLFIISSLNDLPDASLSADRLIRNQQEIGNAVNAFYNGSGSRLTSFLTNHITIAADLVSREKSRRNSEELRKKWYSNADEIANFLQSLNPHWNIRNALYKHLQLTESELTSRLEGNYIMDQTYFDEAVIQSKDLADILMSGVLISHAPLFSSPIIQVSPTANKSAPTRNNQQNNRNNFNRTVSNNNQRFNSNKNNTVPNNQPSTFTNKPGSTFTKFNK